MGLESARENKVGGIDYSLEIHSTELLPTSLGTSVHACHDCLEQTIAC